MEAEVFPVETHATCVIPRPQRLRHPAGHPIVLERPGGIVPLVLEHQTVELAHSGPPAITVTDVPVIQPESPANSSR